ncbi:hypothetical protein Y888_01775 [Mixta calida B021323]|uniref:Secreted protein n=1 Tax=Mixta calida TaxID=665913 RepID=A0ABM6RYQ2_9GAMM|nr:hypothetical protein PSNIH2_18420 [Pantoea sp. PSNIH2]AUY23690.1 hypothetical protein C2E16_01385 [Mixta calida]KAF0861366.1 hypothetical protein Y888_01775 [Mixta calida B021323]POU50715.1 hypothetical protein C3380_05540 [Pantoea sp. PSNIH5]POU69267.1 hypothetical protein C3374_06880 [Pantoea sp. PSNIH4]POY69265.1 hypothetical protein C3402_04090 [Pantoea sp. PSNIH3]
MFSQACWLLFSFLSSFSRSQGEQTFFLPVSKDHYLFTSKAVIPAAFVKADGAVLCLTSRQGFASHGLPCT